MVVHRKHSNYDGLVALVLAPLNVANDAIAETLMVALVDTLADNDTVIRIRATIALASAALPTMTVYPTAFEWNAFLVYLRKYERAQMANGKFI